MAGLLILVLYFYRDLAQMTQLIPNPALYRPGDRWTRDRRSGVQIMQYATRCSANFGIQSTALRAGADTGR